MKTVLLLVFALLVVGGALFFVFSGEREGVPAKPPVSSSEPSPPAASGEEPSETSADEPAPTAESPSASESAGAATSAPPSAQAPAPPPAPMALASSAFSHNGTIPVQYTCDGQDANPPLTFSRVPSGAASLALTMVDPDAPDPTFTHWVVWNISPSAGGVAAGSVPAGAVQGRNGFGETKYGGPCPPPGEAAHRYVFTFSALDATLSLAPGSTRAQLEAAMTGHIVAQAQFTGKYASPAQ